MATTRNRDKGQCVAASLKNIGVFPSDLSAVRALNRALREADEREEDVGGSQRSQSWTPHLIKRAVTRARPRWHFGVHRARVPAHVQPG
jgi:hypothetical protein